jgi:two-component system, chemotaxis family, chemotaxis protein CheY
MSIRALLIDDSSAMRSFIRRVIELTGVEGEFLEASNGREALDKLQEHSVDVVLCDINMPVMNGEQFLEEYGADKTSGKAPVLIVSTDSTLTRVSRMLELGASGYVRKPFTPEMMREALDQVLLPEANGSAACETV